jgi:hypothetical protein
MSREEHSYHTRQCRKLVGKEAKGKGPITCRRCQRPFVPASPFVRFCSYACKYWYEHTEGADETPEYKGEEWLTHELVYREQDKEA